MILPPGLSDVWVMRTRTSVGHFRLGFSRFWRHCWDFKKGMPDFVYVGAHYGCYYDARSYFEKILSRNLVVLVRVVDSQRG